MSRLQTSQGFDDADAEEAWYFIAGQIAEDTSPDDPEPFRRLCSVLNNKEYKKELLEIWVDTTEAGQVTRAVVCELCNNRRHRCYACPCYIWSSS